MTTRDGRPSADYRAEKHLLAALTALALAGSMAFVPWPYLHLPYFLLVGPATHYLSPCPQRPDMIIDCLVPARVHLVAFAGEVIVYYALTLLGIHVLSWLHGPRSGR